MQRSDFHFDLPPELIAQYPPERRGASRLLTLDAGSGTVADRQFGDLPDLLRPEDLLVFNDTKVIPARLHGTKDSGARVEVLIERVLDEHKALAHIRASRAPKIGVGLLLEKQVRATVTERCEDLFVLHFAGELPVLEILERYGHVPLPPYIERTDGDTDRERYQTIYARQPGAVAAPTAGLHFSQELLAEIAARGVEWTFVTLHVGAGTFQPVRVERIEDHRMHGEIATVDAAVCERIAAVKARGGRVIAVGTTAVRCLETATQTGTMEPFAGETRIFIYPGYRFRCVDALITNFHLPESTLLMLVTAFAGYEPVMNAYRHAVRQGYRFFSYGDAMFITTNP